MPVKSELYFYLVCDNCGERADYSEYSAWADVGQAVDAADDWTQDGEKFHCPSCPSLDINEGDETE